MASTKEELEKLPTWEEIDQELTLAKKLKRESGKSIGIGNLRLHLAAFLRLPETIRKILILDKSLVNKVDPTFIPDPVFPPLMYALRDRGDEEPCLESIMQLIAAGSDPNFISNKGETPMHYAVRYCNETIMLELVKAGARITDVDNRGQTPLFLAVATDKIAMARILISLGALKNESISIDQNIRELEPEFAKFADISGALIAYFDEQAMKSLLEKIMQQYLSENPKTPFPEFSNPIFKSKIDDYASTLFKDCEQQILSSLLSAELRERAVAIANDLVKNGVENASLLKELIVKNQNQKEQILNTIKEHLSSRMRYIYLPKLKRAGVATGAAAEVGATTEKKVEKDKSQVSSLALAPIYSPTLTPLFSKTNQNPPQYIFSIEKSEPRREANFGMTTYPR